MKFLKNLTAAALIVCLASTVSFAALEPSASPDGGKPSQQKSGKGTEEKKEFIRIFPGHKQHGTGQNEAEQNKTEPDKTKRQKLQPDKTSQHEVKQQDPVKLLESMKAKLQEKVRNGEITKEKAEALTRKIDAKIKEIEEFNKLSLKEKKEFLTRKFEASVQEKVKEGRINPEEGQKLIRKFSEKIKDWDGTGYPMFGIKFRMYKEFREGTRDEGTRDKGCKKDGSKE